MVVAFPITRAIGRGLIWLVRISAVIFSLALLAFPFQREAFLSARPNGASGKGVGSVLFDLLMQPWLSALLAVTMVVFLIARIRLIPDRYYRLTDMIYFGMVTALLAALQALAYLPALLAPPV